MVHRGAACAFVALLATAACEKKTPPPTPTPNGGGVETISGTERLGWDQRAFDTVELATFRYAIYVDGNRSEVADASCGSSAGASGFSCSGRLPAMAPGAHTLELAAFVVEGGATLESARSAALRVTVTASSAIAVRPGDAGTTADGVRLRIELVAEGLDEPTDLAFDRAGRLFIAQRGGTVRIVEPDTHRSSISEIDDVSGGGLLALSLPPDFQETRHVYVAHTASGAAGTVFRVARYREADGRLGQRAVLLDGVPAASPDPSAIVRIGPDGKLYAAFDDGGDPGRPADPASLNGKLLRLNADGTTPEEQTGNPIHSSGYRSPRGLAWAAKGTLWIADGKPRAPERLSAATTGSARPPRASIAATYALDASTAPADVLHYWSDRIPAFQGNLFVASAGAGHILRLRMDPRAPTRVIATEKLLEGMGPIRALALGPDGMLHFATADAVAKLVAIPNR
jgi:glucose/arabinose dehydrogenase